MNMRATHGLCRFFWLRRHARPDLRRRDRVGARRRRRRRLARRARPRCRRDARPLAQGGACRLRPRGAARVHTGLSRGRRRGGQGLRVGGGKLGSSLSSRESSRPFAQDRRHMCMHMWPTSLGHRHSGPIPQPKNAPRCRPTPLTRTEECVVFGKGFELRAPPQAVAGSSPQVALARSARVRSRHTVAPKR